MLKIKNISKKFTNFNLQNVSFELKRGQCVAIIGPSGSGKTVLMELIAGLRHLNSGSIFLDNQNISTFSAQKRNICLLYQNYMLFSHLSVFENIAYPLKIKKRSNIKESVLKMSRLLSIEGLLHRDTKNLSGGEQQRVALARALIASPRVLLLDEPTSAIDTHLKLKVLGNIKKIHQKLGLSIILVTHNIDEAMYMADTFIVMKNGKILQMGDKLKVFNNPKSKFVAKFLGYKNIYKGRVKKNIFLTNGIKIQIENSSNNLPYLHISPKNIALSKTIPKVKKKNNFQGKIISIIVKDGFYEIIINIGITLSVYISPNSFLELSIKVDDVIYLTFGAISNKFNNSTKK